ncbi:MAG: hypothetical protein SXG53_13275 [Pseudomonadota bacterium]|nr:hypothetical protein [Pseudomonadota bacterium]
MISRSLWHLAVLLPLAACSSAQRKAAEQAELEKETAQEVSRLCALPAAERAAQLEKVHNESDIVVFCGND